jgi:RNA polymerase sigma-70 factor (ECF subfamily)
MEIKMAPDFDLLQHARLFDQQALAMIYDTHSPGLYRYSMHRLGDQAIAEDCVADTFTRFLQALQAGRGPKDFLQAYLYRTAHNWIADHYRRGAAPSEELDEENKDERPLPEEELHRRQYRERLRTALQQLTGDQQQVVTLKFLEGWENEAIARSLKKPVGAVKSLQHRALATLKRILEDEDL